MGPSPVLSVRKEPEGPAQETEKALPRGRRSTGGANASDRKAANESLSDDGLVD